MYIIIILGNAQESVEPFGLFSTNLSPNMDIADSDTSIGMYNCILFV